MDKKIKVSTSILSADFTRLGDEIKKCENAGADIIHVDVMDGHFVPNISIGHPILKAIRPITKLPIETHLMIENPWAYIDDFCDLGADIVSIHAECYGPRRKNCQNYGEFPKVVDTIDEGKITKDLKRIQSKGKQAYV
ncbi:MAG: ribulose-phosphate 3-epimerase, partial [Candidatus Omnitrophica bacterium]|nr:ribulose-phosphate 3-epimerase [Candidatus Omnitrophota bacterium]